MKLYKLILITIAALFICGATTSVPESSVYRVLMAQRPAATDDAQERTKRLWRVSKAIADIARNRHEAAVLISLGLHESRFGEFIARGCVLIPATAGASCDSGRARSYWQLWRRGCREGWKFARGDQSSTATFAKCALRHFRFAMRECSKKPNHGRIEAGFAGYRTTTQCEWEPSKARAKTYRRIVGLL